MLPPPPADEMAIPESVQVSEADLKQGTRAAQKSSTIGVTAWVILDGFSLGGTPVSPMSTNLSLPFQSPYIEDPVTATIDLSQFVDWILLELRDANDPSIIVATKSCLLGTNGGIYPHDYYSAPLVYFWGVPNLPYYIAVRHRNHLGCMTSAPVVQTGPAVGVNFMDNTNNTPGATTYQDAFSRKIYSNGATHLWAGDADGDKKVIFQGPNSDRDAIFMAVLLAPGNTTYSANYILHSYATEDVNMDGNVIYQGPNNDLYKVSETVLSHPANTSNLANFVVQESIP